MSVSDLYQTMPYGSAAESPDAAVAWLESHGRLLGHFINGALAGGTELAEVVNPATGAVLARVAVSDAMDQIAPIAAAAQQDWALVDAFGRGSVLYAIARRLQRDTKVVAVLRALETGQSIRNTRTEVADLVRAFYHHAGTTIPAGREPVGGVITKRISQVAEVLALGNAVVLTPSVAGSLSALYFAELTKEAGLPDGLLSVQTTPEPPERERFAQVVFEDADLDSAVEDVVATAAASRLFVQESVAARVVEKLKARFAKQLVRDTLDKTDVLPLPNAEALTATKELIVRAAAEGIEVIPMDLEIPPIGWYLAPTILNQVSAAHEAASASFAGPVLTVTTFRTVSEAAKLVGATKAAAVWTESLAIGHEAADKLDAKTVWLNASGLSDPTTEDPAEEFTKSVLPTLENVSTDHAEPGAIDRTYKLFIGGKQTRPDSGDNLTVDGFQIPRAGRKDVRNAMEAARKGQAGWAKATAHARAQVLFYLAENLAANGFAGAELVFEIAGQVDKNAGQVAAAPLKAHVFSLLRPVGVVGIVCPEKGSVTAPLALIAGALASGNAVVVIASEADPLPALELVSILESSDIPAGTVNILTGIKSEMAPTLASHSDLDALWDYDAGVGPHPFEASAVRQQGTVSKTVWAPF